MSKEQNTMSKALERLEFGFWNLDFPFPDVVKLVDTSDLGSDAVRCGGSSPSIRTFQLV